MTYSNARIVRGNDFKLQITVEAPRDYISGETIWDDFDLTSCSEIHVALICEKDQIVIPLEYEIVKGTTNVLLCPVHGNYLHSGAAYGVEVKGVDGSGYAWRWKAKGKEMFSIVDNTSAQNLDDNLTPNNFDINARVGFEIHVDLSDYYTKEQVDASQAAQNEAIAALDDKVDVNEADIEAKLAAEIARARAAEQTNADAIDTLSGSTEGSFIQLTARIVAEENRAKAAEDDLGTAIDNEEDRATAAEEALQASINAEAQAARQAEQANATAIANEATRAKAAEASLSTTISEEATRAKAAEATLQGNIDAEEARAKEAEQANTTAITNEVTRAQSAESTLQGNIDAEATRAQGVEATLQQSISTEATRAQNAEATLQGNIDDEEARAQAAEQANTTAITNEVTRAQLAEKDLQNKIDTLEAASGGDFSALTQRIAAEENRAKSAEQAIEADVDALEIAMPLKANSADLATVATSGSYNDLTDKPIIPTVPTNVSAFTNDAGYLVAADVAGKADKSDTYTKEEVDDKIDNIIGGEINLQNYYTKSEIDASQAAQDTAIEAKAPQATTYTKTEVNNLVSPKANSADLATVATSGSYNDLTDKPNIPAMQVQSDWNQTGTSEPDYIKNKPTIPTVPTDVSAFTNDAGYLINTDIEGKADKSDTYTKTEVDDIISQVQAGQGSSLKNYYTKTQIDSQQAVQDAAIALKANSADLATVATSGDYEDLSNKPTIPTVPTNVSAFTNDAGYLTKHQSLDNYYTKFETDNKIDDKIDAYVEENIYTVTETNALFQQKINAQHKLSSDLVDDTNKTNKFVTTEEKAAWNAKSDFSGSYNDLTDKPTIPTQVQADWNETVTSEPSYIKNKPDLSNYYTKSESDGKFLARYRKIQLSTAQLGEGDDAETWHGVGKFWNAVAVYWGSGVDDKWETTGYEFPAAYDSASDNYYVKINNVHAGDEIVIGNMLLKETPSATPHILIINNSGTTVWSGEIPVNSQTNPSTLFASYIFESDYDYIIIGTDCDKPAYVQKIEYYVSLTDNSDLGYVIPTISQVEGELGNKVNYWDIVQSDWEQSDTGAKDYIKNKPTIPVLPNNIVTANQTLSVAVVSSMPSSPDQNTIYVIL